MFKIIFTFELRYCAVVVCSVLCQCKPNAERRELALKSYAEVQPDFAMQRYNMYTAKSKFFGPLISHLESFPHPKIGILPFIHGLSRAFSTHEKK